MSIFFFSPVEQCDGLRSALAAAGLPTDDLQEPGRLFFELCRAEGPIGFVGLEGNGEDLLLRSLVILPNHARQGHGSRLVAHVEAEARSNRAKRLHLLTTSAAEFFRARGFRNADRATAPDTIRSTAQFSSLCPGSAAYLTKGLA